MNDSIKAGMYRGENKVGRQISLDRRIVKMQHEDGTYVDVPSVEYVRELEIQILELQNRLAIIEQTSKNHESLIKRLLAAVKKLDVRQR